MGQQDLTGTKQVMAVDASEAAIAQFHDDGGRAADFQTFMEGTPHSEGGRHDMNPRGLTSDTGEWHNSPEADAAFNAAQEPMYVPGQVPAEAPQPQQDDGLWRRKYGQSENEKGELRAALNQQLEMNAKLMELAFNQPQSPAPTYPPQPSWQPQAPSYGYSQVPSQVSAYQPPPLPPRFVAKADGEMLYAEDVEAVIRNNVAPAYFENHQRTQEALQRVAQLEARLAAEERARMGITPQLEAQALLDQPWLRNLRSNPDVSAYHGALATYKQAVDARALASRAPQLVPTSPLPGTSAGAARRITYIESSGRQVDGGGEPHQGPSDFQRDMDAAMREPVHMKKAAAMRKVFEKYGINAVNDFGDRQVLTR